MESIYSRQLLELCLRGEAYSSALLDRAIGEDEGRALVSIVVERLGDLFEPRLCRAYDQLFSEVIRRVAPELAPRLRSGVSRAVAPETTGRVYVLSRITLGADIAVTSVMLDAAKKRYPEAQIVFVGPKKSYEMFAADARITHQEAPYARGGSLAERLRASAALDLRDGIVIDPDSRLTQLGLLQICDHRDYFFFESRSYGGDGDDSLPLLAARWARETFGVEAKDYFSPVAVSQERFDITVSLGVGENHAKRIEGSFEADLLRLLSSTGAKILVDKGGSAEEHARVEAALAPGCSTHDGAFAPFAVQIARSKLFIGYDSAGQHVASAAGVPLIAIFKGFASERTLSRWRPNGIVVRGDSEDVLGDVRRALRGFF